MGMVWVAAQATDAQLAMLKGAPESVYDFVNGEDAYENQTTFDLDKQWHAVHFLLTGSAGGTDSPLSFIIGSFEELGPDHGYGPAWVVPKSFVADSHSAFSALTDAEIVDRFAPDAMVRDDVYLAETLAEEGDEAREFLELDVKRLRAFIEKAAGQQANVVALIT